MEKAGREKKVATVCRRMWELGEKRWVKLILERLREAGGVGWREESSWVCSRVEEASERELDEWRGRSIEAMSSLRWYRAAKVTLVWKSVTSWEGN